MKQRQLFDKNPNLFLSKSAIIETTGQIIQPLPSHYIRNHHRTSQSVNKCSDLYSNMKPLIVLGRILLIIPCGKHNYSTYKQLKFSLSLLPFLGSILCAIWTFIEVISSIKFLIQLGGSGKLGAMGYVTRSYQLINSIVAFISYVYFLRRSDRLYRIFDKWSEMAAKIDLEEDKFLKYLAYILAVSLLPSLSIYICFIVDLFYHTSKETTSTLEQFFLNVLRVYSDVIPYSPTFVIVHTVLRLWTACSRMFVPPLIIFLSRATSFQFRKLIGTATNSTDVSEAHYADMRNKGKEFWLDLVKRHRELVFILRTINNFMSPIIFLWVALSIYNLSMQLFRGLSGNESFNIPTYMFTTSFSVEVTLFVLTLISAAQVNKNAEKILFILRNCPKEDFYDTEVCRLEHQLSTGPSVGLSGMGCFVITKPFLIKVFNAIFTMEIIMLQSAHKP